MVRKEYPYVLLNNLDRFIMMKQARLIIESNKDIKLKDFHKEMAESLGISVNTLTAVKYGEYQPPLVVAMAMADYLDTTVDELFSIKRKDNMCMQ